jgi:hypothetical protein
MLVLWTGARVIRLFKLIAGNSKYKQLCCLLVILIHLECYAVGGLSIFFLCFQSPGKQIYLVPYVHVVQFISIRQLG